MSLTVENDHATVVRVKNGFHSPAAGGYCDLKLFLLIAHDRPEDGSIVGSKVPSTIRLRVFEQGMLLPGLPYLRAPSPPEAVLGMQKVHPPALCDRSSEARTSALVCSKKLPGFTCSFWLRRLCIVMFLLQHQSFGAATRSGTHLRRAKRCKQKKLRSKEFHSLRLGRPWPLLSALIMRRFRTTVILRYYVTTRQRA
eukprot:g9072.t1